MNTEKTPAAFTEQAGSSAVLLTPGSATPPIFMAHGMGSSVADLLPLAAHLRVSNPIYGLEEKGARGPDTPLEHIEAMAEFHLQAIRRIQPRGPYFLIGYSFGGLVSVEIARRCLQVGEKVALLALLDSYPYRSYLPAAQRFRLLLRLGKRRMAAILHKQTLGETISQAQQRVRDAQFRAWRSYRPQFYEGKICFIKGRVPSFLPDDPVAVWASLSKEISLQTVPGNHLGMLTTHVNDVAQVLRSQLAKSGALA